MKEHNSKYRADVKIKLLPSRTFHLHECRRSCRMVKYRLDNHIHLYCWMVFIFR